MEDCALAEHLCDNPQALEASEDGLAALYEGPGRNILKSLGDVPFVRSIRIFLRDLQRAVVGGVVGELFGGWLYVSLLWVCESHRNHGLGTRLVCRLEEEAARRDYTHAHVDINSFETRPFYEKLGYELFAILKDYPPGHSKHFLRRVLPGPGTA